MNTKSARIVIGTWGFLMLAMAFAAFAQAPEQTQPAVQNPAPSDMDLPRFSRISPGFAVGAQPTTAGIRKLSDLGFKTIVNLVSLKEGSMLEAKTVEFYGMKFVNVEFTAENLNDSLVQDFMQIVDSKEQQPVFVHCKTGNRMAAMLLIYRVKKENMAFEAALKEANNLGLTDSPIRDSVMKYLGKAATE